MLHATEVLGGEAYDAQGNFVGRVSELFIEPADQPNRVARYLLGRGKYLPLLARHDQISSVAPGVIKLNVEEKELEHFHSNEAWLAMRKDLLDQQIIDTRGRKVVRVNDVDLAEHRTNGTVELRITDVDVGLPGAARRLLQGLASPMLIRRIQEKLPARTIRWEFVNLIEPDPAADILEEMEPDEAADVLGDLSPEVSQDVLEELQGEGAREVQALLSFDENSAGGMMTTEFVYVGETATRGEVVEWVRGREINVEQLDSVFMIDGDAKLSGVVPVGRLLLAADDEPLALLKSEPLVSVGPDAKEKEVFTLFDKYNLRSLAVVDASGRPIGAITVDDVITRLRALL